MSDGNPEVNTAPVVLIGPVRVGKSVAGVAELMPRRGTDAAYDDFEGYVAATARHVLYAHLDAVITMGAGHTHYRSRQRHEDVLAAFDSVQATAVLLLPCADPMDAVRQLRQRAALDRADDFRRDDRRCWR